MGPETKAESSKSVRFDPHSNVEIIPSYDINLVLSSSDSSISSISSVSDQNKTSSFIKRRVRLANENEESIVSSHFQLLVEMGYISYRSLICMSGFLIIAATAADFLILINQVGYFQWHPRLIIVRILGFLITQVEGRPYGVQNPIIHECIIIVFPFVQYPWTRSLLYVLVGMFQLYWYTWFNLACGIFVTCLGLLSMLFDYVASSRLSSFRKSLKSKKDAIHLFKGFDHDKDGYLTPFEFKRMIQALNVNAHYNIFVATLAIIDVQNKQLVSLDDFLVWFDSFESNGIKKKKKKASNKNRDDRVKEKLQRDVKDGHVHENNVGNESTTSQYQLLENSH